MCLPPFDEPAGSQKGFNRKHGMSTEHFISMMKPGRPDLHENMTDEESEVFGRHSDYLREQFKAGTIVFAGPSIESHFAVVVLETDSKEAAAAVMDADPAVAAGLLKSEVHQFSIFLMRGMAESE